MKFFVVALAVSAAAVALVLSAAEKPADDPVAQLQGKWVETMKDPQGKTYRSVKLIEGKKETFSRYDGQTLIQQHTVDFEVTKSEHVMIYTFRNLIVAIGPNKGTVYKDPVSYLYQVKGDRLFYTFGMMNDDKQPFSVGVCERVK
ncbi:MAG TPA: hypothetical protein VGH74_16210 [Planctomycetaceae bacterium]